MAISIADSPGYIPSPPCVSPPMPDRRKATPVRQSVWHRSWLPKWLLRDGRHFTSSLRGRHREWNGDGENDDSCTSNSLPQTPLTDAGGAIPRNLTSGVHASHFGARLNPEHNRAVSADRQTRRGLYASRSAERLSTSQFSAPEIHCDDNSISDPSQWLDNTSLHFPDPSNAGADNESISVHGDDFKDILETELDKKWILNLSMRFRNGSDREKFFVTYVEAPNRWRRVTITCNYGRAEPGSLEQDLKEQPYQSEKNARIYESIRDSIPRIEFQDTVTNLRLETLNGQLHVSVTEDANEIILYPSVSTIRGLESPLIPESELTFEAHFSGFAYQVKYYGKDYVKKEITGPESVDEFLYEINALHELLHAQNVIELKGIVVDDSRRVVKGLLLNFASYGDLAGMLQEYQGEIQWERRGQWARQIVHGLAEIHEAGFVQGDLTVTNIVVDGNDDAKIIDINRRGCPIGWEAPEFKQKLENRQRISMYIGVKSDIFQLGMILWAIAMEVDQPERHQRPLSIPGNVRIPDYYRKLVLTCLSEKPQNRLSAKELLQIFPEELNPSHPGPQTANDTQEDPIMGSLYDLHSTVPSDQISREYPHQVTDRSQVVLPSDHRENLDGLRTRQESPSRHPRTEFHGPGGYIDVSSLRHKPHAEEGPVEGVDTAIDPTPPIVTQQDSTAASSVGPNDPNTLGSATGSLQKATSGSLRFADAPNNSGLCPSERAQSSGLLSFVGPDPSCSLDSHAATTKEDNTQGRSRSTREGLGRTSYDNLLGAAQHTQEAPITAGCALELMSSNLPINPAFTSHLPTEGLAQNQYGTDLVSLVDGHKDKSRIRKLRRVSSQTGLNDLFTSHLPINPGLKEQVQTPSTCLTNELCAPVDTPLETSDPGTTTASLRGERLSGDGNLPDQCVRSDSESLLTSGLPINPALPMTALDFVSKGLPKDPVLVCRPEPAHTSGSPADKRAYPTRKHESFPILATTLSRCDLLLKSKLPINPAMAWK